MFLLKYVTIMTTVTTVTITADTISDFEFSFNFFLLLFFSCHNFILVLTHNLSF